MVTKEFYDITIIGGGPVGMFAATYARMRLAKTQIIEILGQLGGQVSALFPAKKIYDIPAFPEITGTELIAHLKQQVEKFEPDIFLNERVESFTQITGGFEIKTSKRTTYSKTIIIATGAGAFEPRKLKVAAADRFEDKQLHYFVKDLKDFSNKEVAIAGGGDSAVDWALELASIAKAVHLIHRRDKFRALESSVLALKETKTILHTPYLITDFSSAQDKLCISLEKPRSAEKKELTVDHLLVNYGFASSSKLLESWALELDHHNIAVNAKNETSIPGVYAIGDIAAQADKLNLMATGFGEAPSVINSALLRIYPEKRQPAHSTQLIKKFEAAQDN